jgi:hypothetical protein
VDEVVFVLALEAAGEVISAAREPESDAPDEEELTDG